MVHVNSWLLLNWRRGLDARIRCGWTISTHIGSSVIRNRLKRWGREFFRRWSAHQSSEKGIDVNMILKRRPKGFYSALTHEEFDEAMARAAAKLR